MNNCEGCRVFFLFMKEGGGLVVYDFEFSDDIVIICVVFCRLCIVVVKDVVFVVVLVFVKGLSSMFK